MFLMFARFSFKSSDLAAEDKNYLEHHVSLARQLPGVRMYLTGKLIETTHSKPDRYRAVLFGYNTAEAGLNSLDCPTGVELMADSAGHIEGTLVNSFEGDMIVPFESRRRGQPCCVAMLMCDLKTAPDDPRYRTYQNSISRLPGLSGYMAGRTFGARGDEPDRNWMEARIFAAADAARRAAGGELVAVDETLMDAPRIYYFEGEVQI
jgi:hypothetical protein